MENVIVRGYPNQLIDMKEARSRLKMNNELFNKCVDYGLIESLKWGTTRKISLYAIDDFIEKYKNKNVTEALEKAKYYDKNIVIESEDD